MTGLTCTIVVSGELGERFVGAFAGLALARESGTTRLTGVLIDQAELNGGFSAERSISHTHRW